MEEYLLGYKQTVTNPIFSSTPRGRHTVTIPPKILIGKTIPLWDKVLINNSFERYWHIKTLTNNIMGVHCNYSTRVVKLVKKHKVSICLMAYREQTAIKL